MKYLVRKDGRADRENRVGSEEILNLFIDIGYGLQQHHMLAHIPARFFAALVKMEIPVHGHKPFQESCMRGIIFNEPIMAERYAG